MKTKREGDLVVLPRDNDLVDVFTGTGWKEHRVFQVNKGHLKLISGPGVSEEQFKELRKLCS
jgi:hypothetical protein